MTSHTMNLRWPGTGLGLLLGCLGFVASLRCEAQNLVPNPGFEESDSCLLGIGELPPGEPTHWFSASITYDYLQSCLPYGAVNGLPMNIFSFQEPYEGEACVGLFTYTPVDGQTEQREWIMAPLLEPLVPGQTYYCSFRANAGFGGNETYPLVYVASDHIGLLFTTYERHWTHGDPEPTPFNHAHIQYDQVLADTTAWTLVSGSFVADSAYTYLMIGNFFNNAQTDTVRFVDPASVEIWYDFSYTLIDAVCVSPLPGGCDLDHGVGEAAGQVPYVHPNPANEELWIGHAAGREVVVHDLLGRPVWQDQVVADRYALHVRNWARGAYVLQVIGGGRRDVVKFVLVE